MDGTSCYSVAVIQSFSDILYISFVLTEIDSVLAYGTEIRMEAADLRREMTEARFLSTVNLVHTILALLDPPNKLLQREDTDLMTGLSIVASATACVWKLCCEEFNKVWAMDPPSQRETQSQHKYG